MLIEFGLIIFIFIFYFLFYVEFKINKNNKIFKYDKELTRQNINNEILLKMPFYFDGSHLNQDLNIEDYKLEKKDKKIKEYSILENTLILLKPYIKCGSNHKLYVLKKDGKIDIHKNNESINYYFIRDGKCEIFLIHPKFRDNFNESKNKIALESYIENNKHFHRIDGKKGNIVFIPNNWLLYIKNKQSEECYIEKLSFSTIINKFMLYFKKNT
tara:strand:+ start:182 stop:823 length:642 start_codon:yes stop_codon:yes gene_type:complete